MKNKIILVVSSLVLLASCGTPVNPSVSSNEAASSTETPVSSVVTSTPVAADKAAQVLAKAMNAESASAALGVKVTAGLSASANINIPVTQEDTSTSSAPVAAAVEESGLAVNHFQGTASLSNFSAEVMAKGLTSTVVNDVAASAKLSGNVAFSVAVPGADEPMAGTYDAMSFAAYVQNGNGYIDLSNEKTVSFLNFISGIAGGSDPTVFAAGKMVYPDVIDAKNLPVFSTGVKSDITSSVQKISEALETYKTYLKTVSYSDGSYAISVSLDKQQLMAFVVQVISSVSSGTSSSFDTTGALQMVTLVSQMVTVNACQAEVRFNESGLVSSAMKIDVAVSTTLGAIAPLVTNSSVSLPDAYASLAEEAALKFDYSASFLHGDDVVVASPNADDYVTATSNPLIQ